MKRLYFLLAIIIAFPIFSFAQTGELWIKTSDKGLYIEHKVMPKEGLFPLGRMYNVHPRHIANFNGLDFNKGLVLGQLIKIPLTDTNFNQRSQQGVPIYYKVGEKEGLTKISNVNNKVALETLRTWNNLSSDNVNFGTKLIVGYLASNEMKVAIPPVVVTEKKQTVETKAPITKEKKEEIKTDDKVVKEELKAPEVKKEDIKPVEVKQSEKSPEVITAVKMETPEQGYFKWHFEQQVKQQPVSKDQTVTSGIFKTTSGWNDGKYYLLMDGVQPGTIIKITNPTNNKFVYAKVLGQMEGINLNKGLDIRISNAAAANLSISETDKFILKVSY